MLSRIYLSNYIFVDDRGIDIPLNKINIVLGVTSIKASIFMAPSLLDGVMSNLNVRYSTPKLSFGGFDEVVHNGTINKPISIYMRFERFLKPLHESFFSVLFSALPVGFDKYTDEFKKIKTLDLHVEILGDRVINFTLMINEHIMFNISRRETWSWKIEVDHKTVMEKTNAFPAVNFSGLLSSVLSSIKYVDIRYWLTEKYQSLGTENPRSTIAKMLIDLFSNLETASRIGTFLKNDCGFTIRLKYIPPSSLGIEYKIDSTAEWKKMNFYDLDFLALIPSITMILGSRLEDTIVILEPAVLSPKLQRALFHLAVNDALENNKQIIFLSNSPIILEEFLNNAGKFKSQANLIVTYYDRGAKAEVLEYSEKGLIIDNKNKKIFEQFWTQSIIDRFRVS